MQKIGIVLCILFLSSCSLDYFEQEDAAATSPEFTFFDATFSRTEDNKIAVEMIVDQLEQYSERGLTYAKYPNFTLYDANQDITTIGFCDVLSVDTELDEYIFYGNVSVISYEHDAKIEASNLRWDGEKEVFSGVKGEVVSIEIGGDATNNSSEGARTELVVSGENFSASGVDFSYSFEGPVSGSIFEH